VKRLALALILLATPAIADTDKISLANLPACTAGNPISLWVLDSVDANTCDPEQLGTSDAHCCCANGAWASCAGSGSGGGNVTLDLGDDGGNDSTAIAEIATIRDRYGIVTEPSADKALFDFAPIDDRYLAGPPASPGTPDDEFDSGTLNGKWTAVGGCSPGTADPYAIQGTDFSIYDLSFRPGWLTIQVADDTNDVCQFYQEYTIQDGSGVYVKAAHPGSGIANSMQFDFAINSSTTGPLTGTYLDGLLDAESTGVRLYALGSSGSDYIGWTYTELVAYFAITRVGTTYYVWASLSGGTNWHLLKAMTIATPPTHLWIGVRVGGNYSAGAIIRMVHVDWIRLGDDNPYTPGW